MTGQKTKNRRTVAGDPLNDLLDDTSMKRSGARARSRVSYAPVTSGSSVWWFAVAASVVWGAAVLAYSWARFALPGNPSSALDAAQSRMGMADWLMILSAIAGPVLLICVIAWLVRRSMELRDESRRLAKAAILLADAAETAEKRAELRLPTAENFGGELISDGPGHLHREIERASHAMNALQTQMSTMETALAKQSAAFDNAAERAAQQNRALSAPSFANSGAAVAAGAVAAKAVSRPSSPRIEESDDDGSLGADLVTEGAPQNVKASAVDLSLEPETPVDSARRDLLAAKQSAGWSKLVPDGSEPQAKPSSASKASLEELRDDVEAIRTPNRAPGDEPSTAIRSPRAEPSAAIRAPDNSRSTATKSPREDVSAVIRAAREPEPNTIDPFDDLGPSAPKAAAGAALGAGIAMGFGASRDDVEPSNAAAKVGAPLLGEPAPAPPSPPQQTETTPKPDEFEFMPRALDWQKFVKAANFPENERDTATLDALYDVLTDPEAAALLQSSEDTLATLADLDLYMEDFVPEMSPITTWRAHLDGKPGVQGLDLPIEQSRINAKLSADGAFRKLSDRFIERYQVMLKRLFREGTDERLALELADSRTGRAYILIAGALGKL